MKLNNASLKDTSVWEAAGIELPQFDRQAVEAKTKENPTWIHFGAGNIFRGFVANAHQKVLNKGLADTGIIAVDTFDFEVIDKVYTPFDNLSLLVLMKADGTYENTVVGSIVEGLTADYAKPENMARLAEIFENPSLQMASFTITEKGYALKNPAGEYFGVVASDLEKGPEKALHTMSLMTALLYKRFQKGAYPMTLVSMDNCSHNGDLVKAAIIDIAEQWFKKGFVEEAFVAYVADEAKITYPISMIDKITPRPSKVVEELLEAKGVEEMELIITSKGSYMAPFVNAEVSEYLVIEDKFTNGRPALSEAGIIFTDRDTVNKVETMKVTTCLNPLHTALAVSGCILGYTLIADEVKDPELAKMIQIIGYEEGLKVVVNPGIVDPKAFIDEVVNERLANPNIPDTPQRIATDTSQKVGIRFGETIKSYVKAEDLEAKDLTAIPMAIALWLRYLLAVDDEGNAFELSNDPLLDTLKASYAGVELGSDNLGNVKSIIANENIFGLNLYECGLGEKIEGMLIELLAGPGAVRSTLKKYFA